MLVRVIDHENETVGGLRTAHALALLTLEGGGQLRGGELVIRTDVRFESHSPLLVDNGFYMLWGRYPFDFVATNRTPGENDALQLLEAPTPRDRLRRDPVSYTHLTLP